MRNVLAFWLLLTGIITKTHCQLYTDDVSDGTCTYNTVAANFTTACTNLLIPQVFTVNFASNALYRNYAESFLGRPAKDQTELDRQCYSFAFEAVGVTQQGYNKANIRTVIPTELDPTAPLTNPLGIGKFRIEATIAQSPGSTTRNQYVTIDQVIWCDNKHVLLFRCVNGTRQDWKLGSVGNPEPWAKQIALDIVEKYGMPRENAVDYTGQNGGPSCPVAPDLVTYTLQATQRFGLPLLGLL